MNYLRYKIARQPPRAGCPVCILYAAQNKNRKRCIQFVMPERLNAQMKRKSSKIMTTTVSEKITKSEQMRDKMRHPRKTAVQNPVSSSPSALCNADHRESACAKDAAGEVCQTSVSWPSWFQHDGCDSERPTWKERRSKFQCLRHPWLLKSRRYPEPPCPEPTFWLSRPLLPRRACFPGYRMQCPNAGTQGQQPWPHSCRPP